MSEITINEPFFLPVINEIDRPLGVSVNHTDMLNYLEKQWGKYSHRELLRGNFSNQWSEITLSLISLLQKQGIPVTEINKEFLEHLEQAKPLTGLRALNVGGVELEALAPFGLSVTSVDANFTKYAHLPEDKVEGNVTRIGGFFTKDLVEKNNWKNSFDIVNTSNFFAFGSGAENLKTLWGLVLDVTKPEGTNVHLLDTDEYRSLFDPKRQKQIFLSVDKTNLFLSHQVLGVFQKIQ